jgi:hypothetical protein
MVPVRIFEPNANPFVTNAFRPLPAAFAVRIVLASIRTEGKKP